MLKVNKYLFEVESMTIFLESKWLSLNEKELYEMILYMDGPKAFIDKVLVQNGISNLLCFWQNYLKLAKRSVV